jgi:tRNA threonylcarbamoyladenosine biosynthesis protein TsaB
LSPLHILALDTTSRAGSVAVARDGSLLYQHSGDPGLTHGQRLPGDLTRALEHAGIRIDDLDLLAVASGPGSFTGLRVGVAAMQGLAVARGLRVVPIPTLEALARTVDMDTVAIAAGDTDTVASAFRRKSGGEPSRLIAAWMDGQRGEVFAALYEVLPPKGGSHKVAVTTIHAPMAGTPAAVLDAWALRDDGSPIIFIGDGAVRYRGVLASRFGPRARVLDPPFLAATIARIAFEEPHRAVEPGGIVPVYIRRSDAELARERRQGSA